MRHHTKPAGSKGFMGCLVVVELGRKGLDLVVGSYNGVARKNVYAEHE